MPVASFNKFNSFVEALAEKVHNLGADSLKVYLTATAPNASTMTKKADLAEIAAGGGYTGPVVAPFTSSAQTGGVYKLILGDVVITATGAVPAFQYVVLFNDTATNKELIGWWDNQAPVNLTAGQSFTVDYDSGTGVIQLQ
jgi:hypothetical protein